MTTNTAMTRPVEMREVVAEMRAVATRARNLPRTEAIGMGFADVAVIANTIDNWADRIEAALSAELARREEPVAWQARYVGEGESSNWFDISDDDICLDYFRKRPCYETRPLYATTATKAPSLDSLDFTAIARQVEAETWRECLGKSSADQDEIRGKWIRRLIAAAPPSENDNAQ